ncbi:MAG: hypothetical protein WAT70_09265 [Rhizobiaceae bacterium]
MSLALLAILVVGGVSGILLAIHLAGGTRDVRLEAPEAAMRRFALDFPEAAPRAVILDAGGDAAFLDTDAGVGLVQAIGDRYLTRLIAPGQAEMSRPAPDRLALVFAETGLPPAIYAFADTADCERVAGLLASKGGT